jgi:NAD(P)H-dependent FMN reductase
MRVSAAESLHVPGRWMRMVTIPNQGAVAKAYQEFDADRSDEAVARQPASRGDEA